MPRLFVVHAPKTTDEHKTQHRSSKTCILKITENSPDSEGAEGAKFRVIIDRSKEEAVVATIIHMAALYADYLLCYRLNGWVPAEGIVTFTVSFAAIFIVIWLIVYFCTVRPGVRKLNEKLDAER